MKHIALVACLALSTPAFAQQLPADAPVAEAKCLKPQERIKLAQHLVAQQARIKSLEDSIGVHPALVIIIGVAAFVAGGLTTYGVISAVEASKAK